MAKVRAYGADATLKAAREVSYGVAPLAGYRSLDFKSTDLSSNQPLGDDPLLGRGRNAQDHQAGRWHFLGKHLVAPHGGRKPGPEPFEQGGQNRLASRHQRVLPSVNRHCRKTSSGNRPCQRRAAPATSSRFLNVTLGTSTKIGTVLRPESRVKAEPCRRP